MGHSEMKRGVRYSSQDLSNDVEPGFIKLQLCFTAWIMMEQLPWAGLMFVILINWSHVCDSNKLNRSITKRISLFALL